MVIDTSGGLASWRYACALSLYIARQFRMPLFLPSILHAGARRFTSLSFFTQLSVRRFTMYYADVPAGALFYSIAPALFPRRHSVIPPETFLRRNVSRLSAPPGPPPPPYACLSRLPAKYYTAFPKMAGISCVRIYHFPNIPPGRSGSLTYGRF